MRLSESLALTISGGGPESFETFRKHINPQWVEEALTATESQSARERRLPASQVVWLVIGMGLFRDLPVDELVDRLGLAKPVPNGKPMARSAIADARGALGDNAMEWLYRRCSGRWGHASADRQRWRELALYGVDGTTERVPDSDDNRDHFGSPTAGAVRGAGGYPQVRIVGLMALRSHLMVDVQFGPYTKSELAYAKELWSSVPDHSLTILDRAFLSAGVLIPLASKGMNRHWLTRAKSNTQYRVVRKLGRKDDLVEIRVTPEARKKDPTLPEVWYVRAIRYTRKGFREQVLLTSLLDPDAYPREEVIELYHERWELELGFDEIKTEMLDREEAIRSQTPLRIYQEVWGILLAYNLVRLEMERIADQAGVSPLRISFVAALREIRLEWLLFSTTRPGTIPERLRQLAARIGRFILPERRSERAYPRAVKIKMSKWPRKRRPQSPTVGVP